jgi:hypothetical protein
MADMYGSSAAELARKSAASYAKATDTGLASLNDKIKKIAGELTSGITTGMSAQEIADKQVELDTLKSQADSVIGSTRGGFEYVRTEADLTADETARQLAAAQTQQAQVAGANLGRIGTGGTTSGLYQPSVADAARALQRTEAATQAYLGGTPSVSSDLLPRVAGLSDSTGATLGLAGISRAGSSAFTRAMSAVEQRAIQEIERDKLVIGSQIENQYRKDAREREARQRETVQNQIFQLTNQVVSTAAQSAATQAQLEAAAAGADTRSGKQIAQAKLKDFKDQSAIQFNYTLREIAARAKDAGLSEAETQAILRNANYNAGAQTMLADRLNNMQSLISTLPTDATKFTAKGGWIYDGAGGAIFVQPAGAGKTEQIPVNTQALVDKLIEAAGSLKGFVDPKTRSTQFKQTYWNDDRVISQSEKKLLVRLFGKAASDPDFYVKLATAPGKATLPTIQK